MRPRCLLPLGVAALFAVAPCAFGNPQNGEMPESVKRRLASRLYKTDPGIPVTGELGSQTNPVRVLLPEGEEEYLSRLRCAKGQQPQFERNGSSGFGPYQRILDGYSVSCGSGSEERTIYIDMYHCVEESQPIKGFEIAPEIGSRDTSICD